MSVKLKHRINSAVTRHGVKAFYRVLYRALRRALYKPRAHVNFLRQ
jgi:hypothetical protein